MGVCTEECDQGKKSVERVSYGEQQVKLEMFCSEKRRLPICRVAMMKRDPWGPEDMELLELSISGMGCLARWRARTTLSTKPRRGGHLRGFCGRNTCLSWPILVNRFCASTRKQALL